MPTTYAARMARLDALAARFIPRLRVALIRDAEAAAVAAEAGATPEVAAALASTRFVQAELEALYVAAGVPEARLQYEALTQGQKAQAPTTVVADWTTRLRRFISTEGALAIRGIASRTRAIIRTVLREAATQGLGIREAAGQLRRKVAALSVERAESIARSELIAASNYGSLIGAQATGLQLLKYWIATMPSTRTRPTHAAANGQTVPLNGSFTVGGAAARYPGDPLLSPAQRVRCRCTVTYKPVP